MIESHTVELTAADAHRVPALRCDPVGRSKGGVVILHAVYGLTRRMGEVCARWAAAGYVGLAPALFARLPDFPLHPYDRAADGILSYASLTAEQIFADLRAASAAADDAGRVAISGFCTGGSWAWRAAAALPFRAQVNFYGSHLPALLDLEPRCPTILHYGDADAIVPLPEIERIRARHPAVSLYVYPGARHAFENPDQGNFDADAAALAWSRSIEFLDRHLA